MPQGLIAARKARHEDPAEKGKVGISNAVALNIEQLTIDLNGGIESVMLSNIKNATVRQIYVAAARDWLDMNIPNWTQALKFQ